MSEEAKKILTEIAASPTAASTKQNLVKAFLLMTKRTSGTFSSADEEELATILQRATNEIAGLVDITDEKERVGVIVDLGAEILRQQYL